MYVVCLRWDVTGVLLANGNISSYVVAQNHLSHLPMHHHRPLISSLLFLTRLSARVMLFYMNHSGWNVRRESITKRKKDKWRKSRNGAEETNRWEKIDNRILYYVSMFQSVFFWNPLTYVFLLLFYTIRKHFKSYSLQRRQSWNLPVCYRKHKQIDFKFNELSNCSHMFI